MRQFAIALVTAVAVLFAVPVTAQDTLTPTAQGLVDQIANAVAEAPRGKHYGTYSDLYQQLFDESANEPYLPLIMSMLQAQFAGEEATYFLNKAALSLNGGTASSDVAYAFGAALSYMSYATPATEKQMSEFGGAIEKLAAAGVDASIFGEVGTYFRDIVEQALQIYKAAKAAEDLAKGDADAKKQALDFFISTVPVSASPMLSGPAGKAFADLMDWNTRMWGAATDGLNVVSDAISSGKIDDKRLKDITDRINRLADRGPWGGKDALDYFKEWAKQLPGIGGLIDAVWPEPEPDQCRAINCDCDNTEAGLLTREYRAQCRASEKTLIEQCRQTLIVGGVCDSVTMGPAGFPHE